MLTFDLETLKSILNDLTPYISLAIIFGNFTITFSFHLYIIFIFFMITADKPLFFQDIISFYRKSICSNRVLCP